jgi:hypothetical protein
VQTEFRTTPTLGLLTSALLLAGCATTVTPQQAVGQLDQRGEKYSTQECVQARQIALSYDDNVSGRMGLGLGLGLLLGPFGLPFAVMADASQAEKRNAIIGELKKHCEGALPRTQQATAETPKKSDAQVRLDLLLELKTKGLLTEAEFEAKRKSLIEQL